MSTTKKWKKLIGKGCFKIFDGTVTKATCRGVKIEYRNKSELYTAYLLFNKNGNEIGWTNAKSVVFTNEELLEKIGIKS